MSEYLGCGDHSCVFDKPRGQGTNGGCRCLRSMTDRKANLRVRRAVAGMRGRIAELEAAAAVVLAPFKRFIDCADPDTWQKGEELVVVLALIDYMGLDNLCALDKAVHVDY